MKPTIKPNCGGLLYITPIPGEMRPNLTHHIFLMGWLIRQLATDDVHSWNWWTNQQLLWSEYDRVWSPAHFLCGFKRNMMQGPPVKDLIFDHRKWKKWRYQAETQYTIYVYIYIYVHILYIYIYIHESRWCIVTSRKVKRKGPPKESTARISKVCSG